MSSRSLFPTLSHSLTLSSRPPKNSSADVREQSDPSISLLSALINYFHQTCACTLLQLFCQLFHPERFRPWIHLKTNRRSSCVTVELDTTSQFMIRSHTCSIILGASIHTLCSSNPVNKPGSQGFRPPIPPLPYHSYTPSGSTT